MDIPGGVPSAHVDQFARSLLPPEETWPVFDYSAIQMLYCPNYVNAAEALLDTATVSAITIVHPTDDLDILSDSVGFPFEGVEVRLVDEADRVVALGEPGEIQCRSVYNMLGYWRQPEATAEAFTAAGFFRTGDLAVQRPDGRYRIVGRLKEMFKSGGYNVYPREFEAVIESHAAVGMAAVVSRPDELWQEVGVAYVAQESSVTADELEQHCRERLAAYKIPKEFVVCDELPLLPIGKVDKVELTRRAAKSPC